MSESKGNPKKAGLGYIIGNYLIRGIGFVTLPVFSRILTTDDFGFFNTFSSYESILFILIGLALHTSFKNAYLRYTNNFRDYVSDCEAICIITGTTFLICTFILTFFIDGLTIEYAVLLILGSTATALIAYYNAYLGIYYRSKEYLKIAGLNAIGNVVVSLVLILTVFNSNRGMGRVYGKTIPLTILAIYLVLKHWRSNKPRLNKDYIKFAFTFSLPLIPHGLSQVVLSSCDRIMISNMIGDSETGIYSFAYTLSAIISVTYSSLDQVWSPWFYSAYKSNRFNEIKHNANIYILTMSLITIIVMLICPEATLLIGSEKYKDAVALAVPVIIGGYFGYIYNFPAVIEYYYEKTKFIASGTIAAALINVVLNYFCIRKWGYIAAAYTTVVTYALYFIFHSIIAHRILNHQKIYDYKCFALTILSVIVMGTFTQLNLNNCILRWTIAIIIGLITVLYVDKKIDVKGILVKKSNN